MNHEKYFDFEMLNKHFNEYKEQISDTFLLVIIVIMVYYIVNKFLEWDRQ